MNTRSQRLDGAADDGSPRIRFQSFFSPGVENTVADTYGRNWKPQALAILKSEGFDTPSDFYGFEAGAANLVNALGGGHPAAIGGSSVAITAGEAAGPKESRFWAIALSSVPAILVAIAAVPVIAVVQDIPFLLCPHRRRLGVDGLVQGSDRYWTDALRCDDRLLCGNVASTLRRYADGFLGAFSRSRGCWDLRIKTVVAVLAAEASGCIQSRLDWSFVRHKERASQ